MNQFPTRGDDSGCPILLSDKQRFAPQLNAVYFLDNFRNNKPNLVEVKRDWDPEDYFHHPQSIPLLY